MLPRAQQRPVEHPTRTRRHTSHVTFVARSLSMPSFPDYQPLAQSFDEEREALISNESSHAQSPSVRRTSLRRPLRPGPIDLSKLDAAFKR